MIDFLFYFFAAVMLISALAMVFCRDVVGCAVFMIVSFLATAALFILLEAYFLAVIEVLVYAGAVMVLFLFIIMLLDVEPKHRRATQWIPFLLSLLGFAALVAGACYFFLPDQSVAFFSIVETPVTAMPTDDAPGRFTTSAKSFGLSLFTRYMLPFQVVGFMLLIAMIGVVIIGKKQRPVEEEAHEPVSTR